MNQHLTDQQLIDYEFRLADATGMDEARTHLDQCEPCRQRFQALVRKFAALDLLRGEIKASEDLLARTVENAVQPRGMGILPMYRRAILALQAVVFHGRDARDTHGQDAHATLQTPSEAHRGRVIRLYRVPALGAVAAAVIAGFALLLVSDSGRNQRILPTESHDQPAREVASAPRLADAYVLDKGQPVSAGVDSVRRAELAPQAEAGRVGLAPPEPLRWGKPHPTSAAQSTGATEIAEKPPFAPASAIELVVLPRREDVQLTIYNGADLTLVRERRNLTLKRGWNWLQFMWANTLIDPTSLALEPLEHKDAVQVQQLVFPPRLRELGRWLIRSEIDGQVPFELTYFTSGLAWRAFYMGTLSPDEKTMHLESYVRVNNRSGEDYEDAQTRLIVGRIHLLDEIAWLAVFPVPYGIPGLSMEGRSGSSRRTRGERLAFTDTMREGSPLQALTELQQEPKEIRRDGLSEYFLYTIEGTETILNQWGKRLLSFEANDIPVTSLYKYDEERWGTETVRFLSFANDKEHKLGETPIPGGAVRVYGRAGEAGHLSYVGAMEVKYIPVGEEVELNLGPARLVEVKPVLMDYRIESHTFDNSGNLSGWDEVRTWKIEVANTRPLTIEVEVVRGFETPYWTLKPANKEVSYTKHDATHARFKLTVAPRSKRVFEYTVTTYHGVRQEAGVNAQ